MTSRPSNRKSQPRPTPRRERARPAGNRPTTRPAPLHRNHAKRGRR